MPMYTRLIRPWSQAPLLLLLKLAVKLYNNLSFKIVKAFLKLQPQQFLRLPWLYQPDRASYLEKKRLSTEIKMAIFWTRNKSKNWKEKSASKPAMKPELAW